MNVETEDIKGIEFVQKGYWVNIISTHEMDARIVHSNGSPTSLKIKVIFSGGFSISFAYLGCYI